eukprot:gnl/MRDRNA2_/MRDRNA2_26208_c0_seq1.p1 gnl/MRDRNA2_/MRDRNA2_26208_c0~~gnl/MRDRNA2_/MRDRNA2_26208_c0_seq1.p1  ORF type:complete len:456 (+),score=92.37 gnl/MRDRNA2_/MRDRNA2_26208_c0_seq1:110-1369(+)
MIFPSNSNTVEINQENTRMEVQSVRLWRREGKSVSLVAPKPRASALESSLSISEALPEELPAVIAAKCPEESTWEPDAQNPYIGPKAGFSDVIIDSTVGSDLKLELGPYGHLMIPALINGQDIGFWVLDTGASNNVLADWAAEKLGLPTFGEVNDTALGGGLSSSAYVKVQKFTTGPMTITDSVFGVMNLDALWDEPPVAGILGYDFFSRAIIEIISLSDAPTRAFIYDPRSMRLKPVEQATTSQMRSDTASSITYCPLKFIGKTPFLDATVKGKGDALPYRNLMQLDTGAGGTQVLLNAAKARTAGIEPEGGKLDVVAGVGEGASSPEAMEAPIKYVEIGGMQFDGNMVATVLDADIEMSNVASGMLGAGLFEDCRLVIDYSTKQLAVERIQMKQEAKGGLWNQFTTAFDAFRSSTER